MPSAHNIPEYSVFKSMTKPFQEGTRTVKHAMSGRGGNMKLVDAALKNYWAMYGTYQNIDVNDFRIVSALQALINACNIWLTAKGGGSEDGLTGKRTIAIKDLRAKAILGKNKAAPVAAHQLTPLHGGYQKERASAKLVDGKKVASSASSVVALHAALPTMDPGALQNVDANARAVLANNNLATMTQAAFESIAKSIGEGRAGDVIEPEFVRYLKRNDRIDLVAFPRAGKLLGVDGQPFSTGTGPLGPMLRMYAIDKYGNLIIRNSKGKVDGMNFNHSSLVQGKEVLCAGEIIVGSVNGLHGQLIYINNNSGHYQPSAASLQAAVNFLRGEGINVTNTKVDNVVPGGNQGPWHGTTFVANINAASDWAPALPNVPKSGDDYTYGVRI